LSEKKRLHEKAKKEMRLSERIAAEIPGFRGYKEKELRREADKLIRNHLYRKLREATDNVKDAFRELSERRIQEVLTDMDRLIMKFDRVAEKINHASYGYTGFFNVVKVEEDKLDRMIEFDSNLTDHVQKIVAGASAFKKEVLKGKAENVREHITNLRDSLESLEETFDERGETILEVT